MWWSTYFHEVKISCLTSLMHKHTQERDKGVKKSRPICLPTYSSIQIKRMLSKLYNNIVVF